MQSKDDEELALPPPLAIATLPGAPLLLDLDFDSYQKKADADRERLRQERDAPGSEPEPDEERMVTEATSLLQNGKSITVQAAALLLAGDLSDLKVKPSDGGIGRELKNNTKHAIFRKHEDDILRWAREGLIDLIDPVSWRPRRCPTDLDRFWFIEPETFDRVRIAVASAAPAAGKPTRPPAV